MSGTEHHGMVLQPDLHLLRELVVLRVVDRELVKAVAGFNSTTRVNTRLLALVRAGLLRRFAMGAAGAGRNILYALTRKGARYLGVPFRGPRLAVATRRWLPTFLSSISLRSTPCIAR